MFGAIGRWLKAVGFLLTGQIDSARKALESNPRAVRARYASVIQDKTNRLHDYKQAVAGLIAQQERKLGTVRDLSQDIDRIERLKAGALAKARFTTETLKEEGVSLEDIKNNADYQKCLAAFEDFKTSLREKRARVEELESDIEGYRDSVANHKAQLQELIKAIDKIKTESHEAVAEVITAQQEKEIADTLTGISADGTEDELQRLRQLRQEARAEAKISRELAGTDHKAQEREFLEYAAAAVDSEEFDSLIGLAEEVDRQEITPEEPQESLPE